MVKLTMEPVTRIEGHAKITVQLDDDGNVVIQDYMLWNSEVSKNSYKVVQLKK